MTSKAFLFDFLTVRKEIEQNEPLCQSIEEFILHFKHQPPPSSIQSQILINFVNEMVRVYATWTENNNTNNYFGSGLLEDLCITLNKELISPPDQKLYSEWLSNKINILSNFVTPEHLDIDIGPIETRDKILIKARKIFSRITNFKTAREKISCVSEMCLTTIREVGNDSGADILMPLLVFIVISSNVPNVYDEIMYCTQYNQEIAGPNNYYLTSILSALSFIDAIDEYSLTIEAKEYKEKSKSVPPKPNESNISEIENLNDDDISHNSSSTEPITTTTTTTTTTTKTNELNINTNCWWNIWMNIENDRIMPQSHDNQIIEQSRQLSITKSGWLYKQGKWATAWKRRWFELRGSVLYYFKNSGDTNDRGSIILEVAYIRDCPHAEPLNQCFEICIPKRVFNIYAESFEEARSWISTLTKTTVPRAYVVQVDINTQQQPQQQPQQPQPQQLQQQQLQQQDIDNSIELAKINEEKERKEEEERKMIIEREEKEIIQNEKHFFEINEINNKNIQKKTNIEMLKEFSRKFLTRIINFEEKYENLIIDAFVWFSYGGGIRLKRKDFNSDNQFSEIVLADFFPLLRFVIFIFTSVLLITFAFHVVLLIAV